MRTPHWPIILLVLLLVGASACGSPQSGERGGKIAFPDSNLNLVNADGGTPTVRPESFGVGGLVWSPDGSKVAFNDSDSVSTYISVVRADGSHYVRVFDNQNSGVSYTWSGTSDQLAYDWADVIFVVRADGSGRRKLVDGDFPSWSPDGRMIAFIRGTFIRVINSDGTADRKLVRLDSGHDCFTVLWSSDSRKIACTTSAWKNPKYIIESGGDRIMDQGASTLLCHVHIIDVGRRSHVQVVGGGLLGTFYNQCDIGWSPDGKQIAFNRNGSLYAVSADGKRERRLGRGFSPSWAPDGSHIAVQLGGAFQPNATISVINVQRLEEHRVAPANALSWSPDGKAFVIARRVKSPAQDEYVIETFAADGGRLRRIWPTAGLTCQCGEPAWQPR